MAGESGNTQTSWWLDWSQLKQDRAKGDAKNGLEKCDPVEYPTVVQPTEPVSSLETGDQVGSQDTLSEIEMVSSYPVSKQSSDPTTRDSHDTGQDQK